VDILTLIATMLRDGQFLQLARTMLAMFGTPARSYLGATLLPERLVEENAYREDSVRYRTILANAGTRYSPSQLKDGSVVGSFLVELGSSDIKRELTAREYDALIRLLGRNASMEAVAQAINFVDVTVNRALIEYNEQQRWQAIVSALVQRRGANNYSEDIAYPNPSGHRSAAGGVWSNDSYDPFEDITAKADLLASKGYTVNRIVSSRQVVSKLAGNANVKARCGLAVINANGQIRGAAGRATLEAINGALQADGLPAIELYDLQYRTETGTGYFLARDTMVFAATTGRDEDVDLGDGERMLVENTLGYVGVGRATGQADPGRVIRAEAFNNKPPRIEAEGWQESLPVITEPEAIGVIHTIS
jgi:hypothetical protein